MAFIFGFFFAAVAVLLVALYRAFGHVKPRELKRRARAGDEIAAILYRSVSYGMSTKVLLSIFIIISTYISFVIFEQAYGAWWAFPLIIAIGIGGAFFIDAKGGSSKTSLWLATKVSPAIAWLLERLHPVFDYVARLIRRLFPLRLHSGLYEKSDLVELLNQQKTQADNRIPAGEIDLLTHALSFGDLTVADALVPKRVVQSISAEDSIGPVLMGELHDSGHSRFPVYDGRKDDLVGILYLHDLVASKQTGQVASVMRKKVTYVHEDFTLYQTLQAFIKTKQHLFIVVNSFEEYVGIITIEDVIERVIGKLIVDEFDQYDDLRAVAAKAAKKDHDKHAKQHAPVEEPVDTTSEVVQ